MKNAAFRSIISAPILAALVWLVFAAGTALADSGFTSVVEDLPLMEGLEESTDAIGFDGPHGRIASVSAVSAPGAGLDAKTVMDFYARTLPQLGWEQTAPGTFVREGEMLLISTGDQKPGSPLEVAFRISPAGP